MNASAEILFPPFRLDPQNEQLWREEQLIALRPKTFAILRYLAVNSGHLVKKEELLRVVWGKTQVSEEGLRDYLREIRQALGDEADAPRFVETVRGRGYRFLPAISATPPVSGSRFLVSGQNTELRETRNQKRETLLVGREIAAELAVHFEQGREYRRAVQYHGQAAQQALLRSAPQEAIALLHTGLTLLKLLPDTPERNKQELLLQMSLGVALAAIKGYGASEVEAAYARAQALCQRPEYRKPQ